MLVLVIKMYDALKSKILDISFYFQLHLLFY